MSSYVISDLHGCMEEFEKMLALIDFSDEDKLYIIGDVVDRGPKSIELLQRVMAMENAELLMGNHESMMYDAISGGRFTPWSLNRGEETFERFRLLDKDEQHRIENYIRKLPYYLELSVGDSNFFLVHASPDTGVIKNRRNMIWARPEGDIVYFRNRTAIVGHTPTCYIRGDGQSLIHHARNVIYIDCGCFFTGVLGCIRLDDMEEFYVRPEPVIETEPEADCREFIEIAADEARAELDSE